MQLKENSVHPLLAQDNKILHGLFAEIGTFNQNGRKYPEDVYDVAFEELIPKIRGKRLLGELDHPIDYDEVRLSNVSHAITECNNVVVDGIKKIYGTIELLDTPAGLIAQALVKAGISLGISSRGIGATRQVRDGVEVTQLKLITYDLVAEPSFENALLSPEKSGELSDSLKYIESKLPLNESVETKSVRNMIYSIRESLINKKTTPVDEIDIDKVEINSLKNLLESTQSTIKNDTKVLIESREKNKELSAELSEFKYRYKNLLNNMASLQEAYNKLNESSISKKEVTSLQEELQEVRKQLAVEKRGMSYAQVSELLEGANSEEEIESRLNSLSSIRKSRHTNLLIESNNLTEGVTNNQKKISGLAAIVAKV